MRRFMIPVCIALAAAGCTTVIIVSTRGNPEDFDPIVLATVQSYYFDEVEVEVPDEIRNDDFEVVRVDLFASVRVQYILHPIEVDLYIGLEPGDGNLSDPDLNVRIYSTRVETAGEHHLVAIRSPGIALRAMRQERFYIKTVIETGEPTVGVVNVTDVYLDIRLERETKGLFPFFYLF